MPDVWAVWEQRVRRAGRPNLAATELSDLELINLLCSEDPDRRREKQILKDEAYRRMVRDEVRSRFAERFGPASSGVLPHGSAPGPRDG